MRLIPSIIMYVLLTPYYFGCAGKYEDASNVCSQAVQVASSIEDPHLYIYVSNAALIMSKISTPSSLKEALKLITRVRLHLITRTRLTFITLRVVEMHTQQSQLISSVVVQANDLAVAKGNLEAEQEICKVREGILKALANLKK